MKPDRSDRLPAKAPDTTTRTVVAGLLTWVIPGAGHFWLGHRGLAVVFFVAISFPYWTGLALGGVLDSVNPRTNRWLLLAELGVGGYTLPCYGISQQIEGYALRTARLQTIPDADGSASERAAYQRFVKARAPYMSFYPESDVAQIYLATAGLLNVLAILDAISRAQTGGLPTFHRELAPATEPEGGA
jgi:hypothetical protein